MVWTYAKRRREEKRRGEEEESSSAHNNGPSSTDCIPSRRFSFLPRGRSDSGSFTLCMLSLRTFLVPPATGTPRTIPFSPVSRNPGRRTFTEDSGYLRVAAALGSTGPRLADPSRGRGSLLITSLRLRSSPPQPIFFFFEGFNFIRCTSISETRMASRKSDVSVS